MVRCHGSVRIGLAKHGRGLDRPNRGLQLVARPDKGFDPGAVMLRRLAQPAFAGIDRRRQDELPALQGLHPRRPHRELLHALANAVEVAEPDRHRPS